MRAHNDRLPGAVPPRRSVPTAASPQMVQRLAKGQMPDGEREQAAAMLMARGQLPIGNAALGHLLGRAERHVPGAEGATQNTASSPASATSIQRSPSDQRRRHRSGPSPQDQDPYNVYSNPYYAYGDPQAGVSPVSPGVAPWDANVSPVAPSVAPSFGDKDDPAAIAGAMHGWDAFGGASGGQPYQGDSSGQDSKGKAPAHGNVAASHAPDPGANPALAGQAMLGVDPATLHQFGKPDGVRRRPAVRRRKDGNSKREEMRQRAEHMEAIREESAASNYAFRYRGGDSKVEKWMSQGPTGRAAEDPVPFYGLGTSPVEDGPVDERDVPGYLPNAAQADPEVPWWHQES